MRKPEGPMLQGLCRGQGLLTPSGDATLPPVPPHQTSLTIECHESSDIPRLSRQDRGEDGERTLRRQKL